MADDPSKDQRKGLLAQVHQYWRTLLKWKWMIAAFFFVATAGATAYSFLLVPLYTATGSVWIEDEPNILPFEDVQQFNPITSLTSQAQLLRSRTLASETIDKLKLYENPDFAGKVKRGDPPRDPADPIFREVLVEHFLRSIAIAPIERGSRLVHVAFTNRNPRLATDVLNAVFDGYIDMLVRKRYSASEQASEFLNSQIAELRKEIEQRENELGQYGSEKGISPLTAAETPTVSRISEVSAALTAATLDRINKLNTYTQLKAAPLGEIPDAPAGSLIQRLKESFMTLSRQYTTRLATVRPEYPEMQKLKTELDSATEALQTETQNLIRNAYNDYQAALGHEQSLLKLLSDEKNEAYKDNSKSVIFNSLRVELENKKTLLDALSKRQSETNVAASLKGLEALNVWIVDRAGYPLAPASPNKKRNILIGFLVGLAGGIGLAIGLEYLNHTVKTSRDVANAVGLPTLGSIPAFECDIRPKGPKAEITKLFSMIGGKTAEKDHRRRRRKKEPFADLSPEPSWLAGTASNDPGGLSKIELIVVREPLSIQAESYRSIRTTLLVSSPPGRVKTILFTSPLAREGKSSTVSNLAIILAEAGKRVVIVDSDLRKPRQNRIFGVSNAGPSGLSRLLSSGMDLSEAAQPTNIPNLYLITSGPPPANPVELLTSDRMDGLVASLKRSFDFVLFDTPPILAVSDALAMGPMADAIILVARGGQTPIQAIKQAKQTLDAHKLRCFGVIINGIDLIEQDGYYARQYYHYSKSD